MIHMRILFLTLSYVCSSLLTEAMAEQEACVVTSASWREVGGDSR